MFRGTLDLKTVAGADHRSGASFGRIHAREAFFSEDKKQKTFMSLSRVCPETGAQADTGRPHAQADGPWPVAEMAQDRSTGGRAAEA
jgi:hypothetical protein